MSKHLHRLYYKQLLTDVSFGIPDSYPAMYLFKRHLKHK